MSIKGDIAQRIYEGRLIELAPRMPRGAPKRRVLLVPDVAAVVEGPWSDSKFERRFSRVLGLLESFIDGDEMVVRMPPSLNVDCLFALLDPAAENVWEFHVREPPRGIRIFGMFADRDVFVGTNWALREELSDDDERIEAGLWRTECLKAKHEWRRLFSSYDPLSGENHYDFISRSRLPA